MAAINLQSAAQFIATASEIAATKGIELNSGTCFDAFARAVATQPERHGMAPMFDHRCCDIAAGAGFWITGHNSQGELVHTQAMRLIDLSNRTLADSLRDDLPDYAPGGFVVNPERSAYSISPGTQRISGRVGYHGELWLKTHSDYRGSGLIAVLARLAMAMAMLHWTPDYLFGFMYSLAACKGLAAREGYMHLEPETLSWHTKGGKVPLEAWLVWMSRGDIEFLMSLDPHNLFNKIEAAKAAKAPKRSRREKVGVAATSKRDTPQHRYRTHSHGGQKPRRVRQRKTGT